MSERGKIIGILGTVDLQKSGYFSVMKYLGFILLTQSVILIFDVGKVKALVYCSEKKNLKM